MTKRRLAWSSQFDSDVLPALRSIGPLDDLTPEWAWGGSTGKKVKVAVIDSGVDADHPAVGAVQGYVEITEDPETDGRLIYNTSPHQDSYGHGTACAGIIRSLAPDCEIYSVKVLGAALAGRGIIFAAGLKWALDNDMHVCNLSLGTTKKDFFATFHELADRAYFRNVMLVTAANNMPIPSFPSMYASVFSVASHSLPAPDVFYYNPDPPVEFGAYGTGVRVPWVNGEWITATGNSFAAPHITGYITRIVGNHPYLTIFQMKAILRALSHNVARPTEPAALPEGDAG